MAQKISSFPSRGFIFLIAFALSPAARAKDCGPGNPQEIVLLTSDSYTGKDSVVEALRAEWTKACAGCRLSVQTPKGSANLLGRLRSEKRRGCKSGVEVVLGLDATAFEAARAEGLVTEGRVFERGVFAFIADTERFPKTRWPKSWREVPEKLKGTLLVQDPRLSAPGVGWLRAIYEATLIPEEKAKALPLRVFPSWSSAYEAFTKGQGAVVWSYATSEAYHRCNEKEAKDRARYLAIPLEEGYPEAQDFVASTSTASAREDVKKFLALALGDAVQAKVATTSWMWPVSTSVTLPPCFRETTQVKTRTPARPATPAEIKTWTDRWSL